MTITARLRRSPTADPTQPPSAVTLLSNGRHTWAADVAPSLGGTDAAPDPHDLLDSALAACTVITLELYVRRKGLPVTSLDVVVEHEETRSGDGRIRYRLQRRVVVEGEVSNEDRARMLAIANKCPIHRVLEGQFEIESRID